MYQDISIPLLVFTSLMPPLLILVHVLSCRLSKPEHASPQTRLAKLIIAMNVLLLAGVWGASLAESREINDAVFMLTFALIVFNGIAYSYFHFFNMSETARRIRMLVEIWHSGGEMARERLMGTYTPETMVRVRLDRLVCWGQISKDEDGLYRVKGNFLLIAAYLVEWIKRILNAHHRRIHDPNR